MDCPKLEDLKSDNHSAKNLPIPLTVGRLITLLNKEKPNATTGEIRLRIAAEPGFDPLSA